MKMHRLHQSLARSGGGATDEMETIAQLHSGFMWAGATGLLFPARPRECFGDLLACHLFVTVHQSSGARACKACCGRHGAQRRLDGGLGQSAWWRLARRRLHRRSRSVADRRRLIAPHWGADDFDGHGCWPCAACRRLHRASIPRPGQLQAKRDSREGKCQLRTTRVDEGNVRGAGLCGRRVGGEQACAQGWVVGGVIFARCRRAQLSMPWTTVSKLLGCRARLMPGMRPHLPHLATKCFSASHTFGLL